MPVAVIIYMGRKQGGSKHTGSTQNEQKKYERYKAENRRIKNKIRKLTKYVRDHPNNLVAKRRLDEITK